jgi:hypothetical protein
VRPVSPEQMQAARMLTSLTLAAFLAVGWVPGLRRHAGRIRVGVLVAFLVGCAVLIVAAFQ